MTVVVKRVSPQRYSILRKMCWWTAKKGPEF